MFIRVTEIDTETTVWLNTADIRAVSASARIGAIDGSTSLQKVTKIEFKNGDYRYVREPPEDLRLGLVEPGTRCNTATGRIADAVAQYLADGKPRMTRVLLEMLKDSGLRLGAADQVLGLSRILSRDGRFQASRAVGWSLKPVPKK